MKVGAPLCKGRLWKNGRNSASKPPGRRSVKRSVANISVALVLLLIAALYVVSLLSKSTGSLRVFVERETFDSPAIGYRAIIVNQGYLPTFVGTCELVEENMVRGVVVQDAVQRWRPENAAWSTTLHR